MANPFHAELTAAQSAADEADLMAAIAAGDHGAPLRSLYRSYEGRIYGLGLRLLGNPGLAEEMVQEAFVRLWRSAPRFDPERGSVATFLFTLARRAAVDLQRRPSSRSLVPETDGRAAQHAPDEAIITGIAVREAMSALSPAHREVLELSYDEDLTQRQIADRLDVPLGTVKTRTYYALRSLKLALEEADLLA